MRYSILFALILITSASAQEKSLLEREPKGWTDLTPGKDLKGWKRVLLPPDTKLNEKNPWKVEDGLLVCDGVGVKEMLLFDKEFGDGVFHVEWRFKKADGDPKYNSGVYVRTSGDGKVFHQAQVAHQDKPPVVGDLFGDTRDGDGMLRLLVEGNKPNRAKPVGDWNTFEVSAKGKTISVWVNGATTCTWKDCQVAKGHIGLQAEFYFIEFRNLKFKPATTDRKADTFTSPTEAGPDFLVQGEYAGEIPNTGKIGAQVVALGEGKFDVQLLPGGLPGAGWDGKTKLKATGKTDGEKTAITGESWSGAIAGGKLTGKRTEGEAFTLERVDRKSPTIGLKPPDGAVVLFDGKNADAWGNGKIVEENLLFCGTNSKKSFAAGTYHFEFRTPFQPKARGQGRGNSGVYILGKEIQVLDSFGLKGVADECGGFYGNAAPKVNMCFPPLSWQTYDVEIKPDEKGNLLATVKHNGVVVHDAFPIAKPGTKPATINLQNHGNPVVYRNIWVQTLEGK